MTKKTMMECSGLTDVVSTIETVVAQGGEIDLGTIGGTGSAYHDYSFTYADTKGETHTIPCKGRVDLVTYLYQVIKSGGKVEYATLSALGGRLSYTWFEVEMPETINDGPTGNYTAPEEMDNSPTLEEPKEDTPPNASVAAIDLARAHGINLADVQGTGKSGKINKPDVIKHLEKLQ